MFGEASPGKYDMWPMQSSFSRIPIPPTVSIYYLYYMLGSESWIHRLGKIHKHSKARVGDGEILRTQYPIPQKVQRVCNTFREYALSSEILFT